VRAAGSEAERKLCTPRERRQRILLSGTHFSHGLIHEHVPEHCSEGLFPLLGEGAEDLPVQPHPFTHRTLIGPGFFDSHVFQRLPTAGATALVELLEADPLLFGPGFRPFPGCRTPGLESLPMKVLLWLLLLWITNLPCTSLSIPIRDYGQRSLPEMLHTRTKSNWRMLPEICSKIISPPRK